MDDVDVSVAAIPSPQGKARWDIANVAAVTIPDNVHFVQEALPDVDPAGVPDWNRPGRIAEISRDLDASAVLANLWKALGRLSPGHTRSGVVGWNLTNLRTTCAPEKEDTP